MKIDNSNSIPRFLSFAVIVIPGILLVLVKMMSSIGWKVVAGDGWYVTVAVLYLPLLGLAWLAYRGLNRLKK